MGWIRDLPLLVILMGIAAGAMFVPALHGFATDDEPVGRAFLYAGLLFLFFTALLALATHSARPRQMARSQLLALVGAYAVLPAMMAVPFAETPGAGPFLDAWFEMVSCFTTTGATLHDDPARLPPTLHLWRGLVGWLGGALVWVAAVALLAPMNLGGFEVLSDEGAGQGAAAGTGFGRHESARRLAAAAAALLPVYAGLTGLLWLLLILAGSEATTGLVLAMATLSTSGVSASGGLPAGGAGIAGEVAVAGFLVFALSQATFAKPGPAGRIARLGRDPELRLALLIVGAVSAALFLRHWFAAAGAGGAAGPAGAFAALWGSLFTVLSFLTTTGFVSAGWADAQGWAGLATPGVLLLGLAVIGGGVATTAGGVKLLRIRALSAQAAREMARLIHPSSVGGAGPAGRRLRRQGAGIAWVFFMLFAMSIALVAAALALAGLGFEQAMVLTVAALSTTGPLAEFGAAAPIALAPLGSAAKGILMAAMVLGRLETLALIALLNPAFWRG